MATNRTSVDGVHTTSQAARNSHDEKKDISEVERVMSSDEPQKIDHINYDRVDAEVAKYADATGTIISEEEDKRLKRLIDRRVLPVMVITYFLQSLDKGTMSATSIMGIRDDIPVLKLNGYVSAHPDMEAANLLTFHVVRLAHYLYLPRCPCRRIPYQLDYSTSPGRQISWFQHPCLECSALLPRSVLYLPQSCRRTNPAGYLRGRLPARFPGHDLHLVQAF